MIRRLAALVCLATAVPLAHAQHSHAATPAAPATAAQQAFLDSTRAALVRFRDVEVAIAAGYRPLGPDMPHMGQHWVHPGRAVRGRFVASEPAMLTYLDVEGVAVLTGAAYTVPVGPGHALPAFPYAGAWHAHAGDLMDEAFGLVPHGARDADEPRLAMLHAWTEAPNPDGVWAADHWGLPFRRLGLAVPAHVPPDAGRAVALVAGYAGFYREAARWSADLTPAEAAHVDAMLVRHTERIQAVLALDPANVDALAAAWAALWRDLEAGLMPATADALRPVFGVDAPSGTHAIAPASPHHGH